MRSPVLPLVVLLLASGCAKERGEFPSLLPRAIEQRSDAEPERPVPVATADPALDAQIAKLTSAVDAADAAFRKAADRAEQLARAARGAAQGSERWLDAQTALAEVDVARSEIQQPIAELERLAIDRAAAGEPAYPALDAALKSGRERADAQVQRVRTIEALLA
ncbi:MULTISPECIES: hypothetical protein [Sphingomonas]|uniref:DUF4398 domain-containing protein n=1 Tax=Sphingomonas molluscorum TaxID=418184 RepID=A0ABU8Q510_9SPHN|nr:hypothetical protein [Sphingomonas sp. JUb134]MBM7406359.1 outer membrane murein-binding lipoprotein Lpp [Sphingomonas sp. JUb134]